MCRKTEHRTHKGLNNRVENAHQPTRRKEKILIKFKSSQRTLSLMGQIRNIFAVDVGRYSKTSSEQRTAFAEAKSIWNEATHSLLAAWNSGIMPFYSLIYLTWRRLLEFLDKVKFDQTKTEQEYTNLKDEKDSKVVPYAAYQTQDSEQMQGQAQDVGLIGCD